LHARLGLTMMYVTHDQAEALTLSDRIAVFAGGRLRQIAAPRVLYDSPADAFVSGFVGENNRLPGTVIAVEDGACQVRLDGGAEIEAIPVDSEGPGTRCVVMVRPERIAVAPVAALDLGAEGVLAARLTDMLFQGDHVRLRLVLEGGVEVVAKRPIGGAALPAPGEEAAIAWPAGIARAYRDVGAG